MGAPSMLPAENKRVNLGCKMALKTVLDLYWVDCFGCTVCSAAVNQDLNEQSGGHI